MRSALVIAFALVALAASPVQADSGLVAKRSALSAAETLDRLEPLKALAWEDDKGQARLSYNAPQALASRHGPPADSLEPMTQALERLTELAIRP